MYLITQAFSTNIICVPIGLHVQSILSNSCRVIICIFRDILTRLLSFLRLGSYIACRFSTHHCPYYDVTTLWVAILPSVATAFRALQKLLGQSRHYL